MSFSSGVKEELSRKLPKARHCQLAECAALLGLCGTIRQDENGWLSLFIRTENVTVARTFYMLLREAFGIRPEIRISRSDAGRKKRIYVVAVEDHGKTRRILEAVKMIDDRGEIGEDYGRARVLLLTKECCRRAFMRGAFLAAGSVSDPERFYHLEFVCPDPERAAQLVDIMGTFSIEAKTVVRKRYYVVYIKEGSQIVEMLGLMGADSALMAFENVRIVKEMRNSVNRQVNCETANIAKTVSAAVRQLEDITYIRDTKGLDYLPRQLREIAELRLAAPDAPLKDLGERLDPPVGKSGVNHRLRKIGEIADSLRGGNDGSKKSKN
jgi:DNA-binding protein WhiA